MQMTSKYYVTNKLRRIHEIGKVFHVVGGVWEVLHDQGKLLSFDGSYDWFSQWLCIFFLNNSLKFIKYEYKHVEVCILV